MANFLNNRFKVAKFFRYAGLVVNGKRLVHDVEFEY